MSGVLANCACSSNLGMQRSLEGFPSSHNVVMGLPSERMWRSGPPQRGVCLAMLNGYREATLRTRKRPSVAVGVGVYADVDDMSKGCRDMLMALTRHLLPKTSSTNIFGKYNIELWRLVGAAFAGLRLPSGDAWLASAAFCDRVEEARLGGRTCQHRSTWLSFRLPTMSWCAFHAVFPDAPPPDHTTPHHHITTPPLMLHAPRFDHPP